MRCSRATRAAAILPSIPRPPKPPGIRIPSACCRRARTVSSAPSSCSESIQSISTVLSSERGRVAQRLGDRQVGVLELHVLADERDPHGARGAFGAFDRLLPARQVRWRRLHPELLEDEVVDALLVKVSGTL